jgi:RNA polymerase sigma factor (sigma-70 family)
LFIELRTRQTVPQRGFVIELRTRQTIQPVSVVQMQAGALVGPACIFFRELLAGFGQSLLVERFAASSLPDAPDGELVQRARSGERDAFAEIYRRYHAVVYRFARLMSGSPAIGEDVTQETFTVLLRDLHRYRPHHSSLTTYLYGVARNLTRSYLRRNRRFVRLDIDGDQEPIVHHDPLRALERSRKHDQLRRIIAELPSRYREVVILCAIHGCPTLRWRLFSERLSGPCVRVSIVAGRRSRHACAMWSGSTAPFLVAPRGALYERRINRVD